MTNVLTNTLDANMLKRTINQPQFQTCKSFNALGRPFSLYHVIVYHSSDIRVLDEGKGKGKRIADVVTFS